MRKMRMSLEDFSYILVFALLIAYMIVSASTPTTPSINSFQEVEVNEGDTLWSIASMYSTDINVSTYISLVKVNNGLHNDQIFPGQKLLVPHLETTKVMSDEGDYLLSSKY